MDLYSIIFLCLASFTQHHAFEMHPFVCISRLSFYFVAD